MKSYTAYRSKCRDNPCYRPPNPWSYLAFLLQIALGHRDWCTYDLMPEAERAHMECRR